MKYYIISGEASGDLHGSNLIKAILQKDPEADIRCWGGDLMEQAGGTLVEHYRNMAFMGFVEVVKNLRTIMGFLKRCEKDLLEFQPNHLILIDYPGFNLRMAAFARKQGFKVNYYISPQVWAWNSKRVKKIKKIVDRMFVILPFEKDFYKEWDFETHFVGHPLLDALQEISTPKDFLANNQLEQKEIVALLPGSRKQEINKMLPTMMEVGKQFPHHQFVIASKSSLGRGFWRNYLQQAPPNVKMVLDDTYALLQHAKAAIVTSGTATLETALFEVPQVVCYKGNPLSYQLGKRLVNVKYISLVNLILDRPLLTELIQKDYQIETVKTELDQLLHSKQKRQELNSGYTQLKTQLGGPGASQKVAQNLL